MVRLDRDGVLDERDRETLERLADEPRDDVRAGERPADDDRDGVVIVRRVLVDGLRPMVRAGVRLLLRRIVEPLDRCELPRVGSREMPPLELRAEFER